MEPGLGTAQFGLNYGVTNNAGKISSHDQQVILEKFFKSGWRVIDTAAAYGDAEISLGKLLNPFKGQFRCVTKLSYIENGPSITERLHESLRRLNGEQVYGLLIHNYHELGPSQLEKLSIELLNLRRSGLAERVGASLYTTDEVQSFKEFSIGNLMQIPLNVLDWRFQECPTLRELKKHGVEIHARSLFLQGLLLDYAPDRFPELKEPVSKFHEWLASIGVDRLNGCWAFAKAQTIADVCIFGVASVEQFCSNASAFLDNSYCPGFDAFAPFKYEGPMLDPRNWRR